MFNAERALEALGDPTRRAVFKRLRHRTLSVREIADGVDVTLLRAGGVEAADMCSVLAAGATREHVEDALAVAFAFNTMNRLADAFGFTIPGRRRSKPARNTCSRAGTADVPP